LKGVVHKKDDDNDAVQSCESFVAECIHPVELFHVLSIIQEVVHRKVRTWTI
jgi:hypothetical protein